MPAGGAGEVPRAVTKPLDGAIERQCRARHDRDRHQKERAQGRCDEPDLRSLLQVPRGAHHAIHSRCLIQVGDTNVPLGCHGTAPKRATASAMGRVLL